MLDGSRAALQQDAWHARETIQDPGIGLRGGQAQHLGGVIPKSGRGWRGSGFGLLALGFQLAPYGASPDRRGSACAARAPRDPFEGERQQTEPWITSPESASAAAPVRGHQVVQPTPHELAPAGPASRRLAVKHREDPTLHHQTATRSFTTRPRLSQAYDHRGKVLGRPRRRLRRPDARPYPNRRRPAVMRPIHRPRPPRAAPRFHTTAGP